MARFDYGNGKFHTGGSTQDHPLCHCMLIGADFGLQIQLCRILAVFGADEMVVGGYGIGDLREPVREGVYRNRDFVGGVGPVDADGNAVG